MNKHRSTRHRSHCVPASTGASSAPLADSVATLYRAVGPGQLDCIKATQWQAFPPRRESQRFFYPILNENFARAIASSWNVRQSGIGYVLRFQVKRSYLEQRPIYMLGPQHKEYRIPAAELEGMNEAIVGQIELLATYHGESCPVPPSKAIA